VPTDATPPVAEDEPEVQRTEHEATLHLHYQRIYRSFWLMLAWSVGLIVSIALGIIVNATGLLHSGNFLVWMVTTAVTIAIVATGYNGTKHLARLIVSLRKTWKLEALGEPKPSTEEGDDPEDAEAAATEAGFEIGDDDD